MSLPQAFIEYISRYPQLSGLGDALTGTDPCVSVRVNTGRGIALPGGADTVPWADDCGMYVTGPRPLFTFDPAMHQGLYYVQDASSMAVRAAVRHIVVQLGDVTAYLDACAAPGGKTTCAIDALPRHTLVVANEYDYQRANILAENVMKWGSARTIVSRGDTSRFRRLPGMFDIIAADVPCSGEGMMRKDAKAVAQWSPALVAQCADRQRQIVDNLWGALTPGGYMIYSTCTFNREENEEIVDYLIQTYDAESVAIPALDTRDDIIGAIGSDAHCYRFIPGRVRGEGLFMAVLRKPGERQPVKIKPLKTKPAATIKNLVDSLDGEYVVEVDGDAVYAVPADVATLIAAVSKPLNVVHRGVRLATLKGKDAVPHQSLALAVDLRNDAFARVDVSYADAIAYLRRQAISLGDAPRGDVLLTYLGRPLGFVKNLGNRANNRYPEHWAIQSPPPPGEVKVLD